MEAKSETSEILGGNTNSPKITYTQRKKYCFTLNNWTTEQCEMIERVLTRDGFQFVFGEEICPKTGTRHLQGYVQRLQGKKGFRPSEIKWEGMKWNQAHWEKAKGSRPANEAYCSKDGKIYTNMKFKRPLVKMTYEMLYPWQKRIADRYVEPEDPLFGRNIDWYWDEEGNIGKSVLAKYLIDQKGAMVVGGNKKDIFCGVAMKINEDMEDDLDILVVHLTRAEGSRANYKAIEQIKDGFFFNEKYESGMCRFNSPHIVCFANFPPETEAMSGDRWNITEITDEFRSE